MVGNTESYTSSDWLDDMRLAKNAHIDAFALNMAHGDPVNEQALPAAFSAAASTGLSLFFSFDYAGNGSWPPDTVIQYINKYAGSGSYFHHQAGLLFRLLRDPIMPRTGSTSRDGLCASSCPIGPH